VPLRAPDANDSVVRSHVFGKPPGVHTPAVSKPSVKTESYAGQVLRIPVPGAARSTDVAPKFEKSASVSASSVAATQIRLTDV
jgi:hypothetical protein